MRCVTRIQSDAALACGKVSQYRLNVQHGNLAQPFASLTPVSRHDRALLPSVYHSQVVHSCVSPRFIFTTCGLLPFNLMPPLGVFYSRLLDNTVARGPSAVRKGGDARDQAIFDYCSEVVSLYPAFRRYSARPSHPHLTHHIWAIPFLIII